MASAGARAQKPVGSAAWISSEKENITQMVDQEMEEVQYPISHEIAWLNEHMSEIFSQNQFNFTEVFKTPGKLRGKTPRTVRKWNADEPRVPLSEIFSSTRKHSENTKSKASPAFNRFPTKATAPTISTTTNSIVKDSAGISHPRYPDLSQNLNSFPEYNADSGYYGMSHNDDVVLAGVQQGSQSTQPLESQQNQVEQHAHCSPGDRGTIDSFHSAHESVHDRGGTEEPVNMDSPPRHRVEVQIPKSLDEKGPGSNKDKPMKPSPEPSPRQRSERGHGSTMKQPERGQLPARPPQSSPVTAQLTEPQQQGENDAAESRTLENLEDIDSPSDDSSPDPPLIRKSSLTFASLPAREPLTKKSLGATRISRTSHVGVGKLSAGGSSYVGRQTGGHRTTQAALEENLSGDKMDIDDPREVDEGVDIENRTSKLYSKSSTQRLHEKISMLGKSQPSRPTKSIPPAQVNYPELPTTKPDTKLEPSGQNPREMLASDQMEVDNGDWIKPLNSPHPPLRKNQAMDAMELDQVGLNKNSGNSLGQDRNNDNMDRNAAGDAAVGHGNASSQKGLPVSSVTEKTTTPVGSPQRQDGPLSASKLRLQSIMRSAKSLFSSSGGASEAARVENSSPGESRATRIRANTHTAGVSHEQSPIQLSSPVKEVRRTRSSTEREERRKLQELEDRREAELSKMREQEMQKTAPAKKNILIEPDIRPASPKRLPRPQKQGARELESAGTASKSAMPYATSQQPSKPVDRRPVKPTREPVQKPKPQPVSIRVGSALSRQMPLASSSISSSVQESNPPAPATTSGSKQQTIKKKPSNSSLHTAPSNSSFKSSTSSQSQQRKAQLANERKKEQEERELRRKEEQKRELERKRVAQQQQEEARRQELRSRAEAERKERERLAVEDSRKAAQMQAIEKRRLENARRAERQDSQQPSSESENPGQPSRGDLSASRAASRLGSAQPFARPINQPQPNPAKPPKRGLEDESGHRPVPRKPSATMQPSGEAKRRKTEDEQNPLSVRPTMAPPIRQSNIRKEPTKPSMFGHGQPSTQLGSLTIKPGQPQRPAHPMDMAKYTTGKIPFAESSNAALLHTQKTPAANSSQKAPARPSPQYPNGENIALPEIATDSEDEDSDAEMLPVPKWAQPKELESLLRQQEGMEVDSIFGPIAPFSLEETFKSDKKIKKFRERTSSANWSGPDALTQDEIRRDLSERQRMRLNGGWSFNG